MKKHFLILFPILLLSLSLSAQTLTDIESVEYDASQDRWFVSNGSSIIQISNTGELSYFGNGSANFAMEVMDGILFVIKGPSIQGYDLQTEEKVFDFYFYDAISLNGLTHDGNSNLYTTDFLGRRIIKIDLSDMENPVESTLAENLPRSPNAIVYDEINHRLIFVNWGGNAPINAIDLNDNTLSTILTTEFASFDGIDEDNEGNFYVSTWTPSQIVKYNNNFSAAPETISTPFVLTAPSDICYAKEIDVLGIPHYPNDIHAVEFLNFSTSTSMVNINSDVVTFDVFPNPISQQSVLQFELERNSNVNLDIFDTQGRLINNLLSGKQHAGKHSVSFNGHNLPSGVYICTLRLDNTLNSIEVYVD